MGKLDIPQEPEPRIVAEGRSAGLANENETLTGEERVLDPGMKLSKGPKMGKAGEYLPAAYPTKPRKSGKGKDAEMSSGFTRIDR